MAQWIPSWKERLVACFQWRHRLLHVFGAPTAVGVLTAAVGADWLNASAGMGLGALVTGVGALIAGYYVVSGFDRGLVENLQAEHSDGSRQDKVKQREAILSASTPDVRAAVERIMLHHQRLQDTFDDGIDDQVEAVLSGSRQDLMALLDRALVLAQLHSKLGTIIAQSDQNALRWELQRIDTQRHTTSGAVRESLETARQAAIVALERYQGAVDKQHQVRSVLTVIEASLHDFKLAMELRKADATLAPDQRAPDVSELQGRLLAAEKACDELVGGLRRTSLAGAKPRAQAKSRSGKARG